MLQEEGANQIIKKVINFLKVFMPETLAKRIVSMILLAVGVEKTRITELTGLCSRSIHSLKKAMETGEVENQFKIGGGGRKRKLQNVETAVIEEVEQNNYHSLQQIADMIYEKHSIKISAKTVGRLLKKTKLSA